MEENEIFGETLPAEPSYNQAEPTASHEAKKPKNKYSAISLMLKIVATAVFLLSIVCGIAFGFTEAQTLVPYGPSGMPALETESVFELWRAVLFGIVGLSNGICLWAVSAVFTVLAKKQK